MSGNLVVLACATEGVMGQAEQCVALGVFGGTEMYRNVLEPDMRYRGRPDNVFAGQDNNHLLAPVHVVSCLTPDCGGAPMTWRELMEHHAARMAAAGGHVLQPGTGATRHARCSQLPPELELLVADVRNPLPEEMWTMWGLAEAMAQAHPRPSVPAKEDKARRAMLEDVTQMCWDAVGDHTAWTLLPNNRGARCQGYKDTRGHSKHTPRYVLKEAAKLLRPELSPEHAAELQAMADEVELAASP